MIFKFYTVLGHISHISKNFLNILTSKKLKTSFFNDENLVSHYALNFIPSGIKI